MSQIFKNTFGSPPPPSVPTDFVTDDGTTAVPASNILNVNGSGLPNPAVIDDDDDGISTYANPDLSNNLAIFLTNRKVGSGTTVGAGTTDLFTQALQVTPGVYNFTCYACAFAPSAPAGAGFTVFGSIRSDGVTANLVQVEDILSDKEAAIIDVTAQIVVSGNNAIFRVTGQAGLTVDWKVLATYIFVS